MSGFVWYSWGGDISGQKLAEALGYESGRKTPNFSSHRILLGWGCKPGEKYDPKNLLPLIARRDLRVINHPDAITANRDKIAGLKTLGAAGVAAPGYVTSAIKGIEGLLEAVKVGLKKGTVMFPLIGYNSLHKGTPIFCHTLEDVKLAIATMTKEDRQAHYFRSFCPGTEYRIHVLRDEILWSQMKVLGEDPLAACQADLLARLQKRAAKEKVELPLSNDHVRWMVSQLATEMLASGVHLQRSVRRGWKYQDVDVTRVPDAVLSAAITGLDALGLDLGAVSVIFEEKVGRVTNVTTAPALSEEQLTAYTVALRRFAGTEQDARVANKGPTAARKKESAASELVARLRRKISSGVSQVEAEAALKALGE